MSWLEKAQLAQSVLTSFAIVGGALWAYFNYFRGRTYKPRLEPKVVGSLTTQGSEYYLLVVASLKNVGSSKIMISQTGSGIRVLGYKRSNNESLDDISSEDQSEGDSRLEQEHIGTRPVFESHEWIEPGELIEEQQFLELPPAHWLAAGLELRIVALGNEWNAATIALNRTKGGLL